MSFDAEQLALLDNNVPAELRAVPQWVVWRREQRLGDVTKVPYSVRTGNKASSTNRDTWTGWEEAKAYLWAHRNRFDGIGFVVTANDSFVGVDLDHVLSPDNREFEDWAAAVITTCDTYTEVSPSGTGIRMFATGEIPPGRRKRDQLEMYAEGRYLTVTGDILIGGPTTVNARTEQLRAIHEYWFGLPEPPAETRPMPGFIVADDHDLLERMFDASNGERIRALWLGNRTGYASDSESDQALISHLTFWCRGDTQRVDALFRQSGLYREKWDERHSGDGRTYGQMTLAKALQGLQTQTSATAATPRGAFFGGVPF